MLDWPYWTFTVYILSGRPVEAFEDMGNTGTKRWSG